MERQSQTLIDYFMERMVEPVVAALKEKDICSEDIVTPIKIKMEKFGEDLMNEINRSKNSVEINQTISYLLDKVDEMELFKVVAKEVHLDENEDEDDDETLVSPPLTGDEPDLSTEGMSLTEMILLNTLCSSDCMQITESPPRDIDERLVSPPISSSDESKGMPSRKRAKRSLEDTVQMLSKENSISPPPPTTRIPCPPPLPFVLPQVPVPFSNTALMQRWLGSPFTNPVYLNAMNMFQPPKPSDEQLAALMKMSMHAANFMKTAIPIQASDSDQEDIKIDVESDEGGVSPSPSNGDITENESSSSSSGPMTSPTSRDGDSAAEKPFICMHNNCGKRFANKFLLKKHMFIHTGLRPHTCPHCHKKFNRKDNLLRHKKTHTPIENPIGALIPKNPFQTLPPIPALHNLALSQSFNHFHALKMTLENGATAVRSLS